MIRAVALVLLLMPLPAMAQGEGRFNAFGIGTASCATWSHEPLIDAAVEGWILGYWTGLNVGGRTNRVGQSTDAKGIVGEVQRECSQRPSIPLWQAAYNVYARLLREGR